ncbi:MAG: SDR family oxidoreductase [Myxococcales bacterium]|nr:SDR family oxidoreductase [Myxococcales bacterium]
MNAEKKRVAVVTGASGGIGEALAKELGRRGWLVTLAARREEELRRVAAEMPSKTAVVVADVTRRADVERIREETLRVFGHVDAWINNAGRGIAKPTLELTDDDVDEMITVNVKSALYGMQAIIPYFQAQDAGHLVNVSSFLGRVPLASIRSAYSAAKAALNSLTANLRMDLAATHPAVHVSLVMPGIVSTSFAKNVRGGAPPPGAVTPAGPPPALPNAPAGAMTPQTAEEVASQIADLLDTPTAELYTNPAHPEIARAFASNPGSLKGG